MLGLLGFNIMGVFYNEKLCDICGKFLVDKNGDMIKDYKLGSINIHSYNEYLSMGVYDNYLDVCDECIKSIRAHIDSLRYKNI